MVPEQLNIKAVAGACTWLDGCSLELCSVTVSVVSAGICHSQKIVSITSFLYKKIFDYITYINTNCEKYDCEYEVEYLTRRISNIEYQNNFN